MTNTPSPEEVARQQFDTETVVHRLAKMYVEDAEFDKEYVRQQLRGHAAEQQAYSVAMAAYQQERLLRLAAESRLTSLREGLRRLIAECETYMTERDGDESGEVEWRMMQEITAAKALLAEKKE